MWTLLCCDLRWQSAQRNAYNDDKKRARWRKIECSELIVRFVCYTSIWCEYWQLTTRIQVRILLKHDRLWLRKIERKKNGFLTVGWGLAHKSSMSNVCFTIYAILLYNFLWPVHCFSLSNIESKSEKRFFVKNFRFDHHSRCKTVLRATWWVGRALVPKCWHSWTLNNHHFSISLPLPPPFLFLSK